MPTTKTITIYSAEEKRQQAFTRWRTVSGNLERWKTEALEAGDIERQLELDDFRIQPDKLWKDYLLETRFQLSDQVGDIVCKDYSEVHPDARERISLLDAVVFILERGTTDHIKRADEALKGLFREVDGYISPEDLAEIEAEAAAEMEAA